MPPSHLRATKLAPGMPTKKPRVTGARELRLMAELDDVDKDIAHLQRRRADLAALIMRERVDDIIEEDRVRTLTSKWMRKTAVVAAMVLVSAGFAQAQTRYPLGTQLTLQWDKPTTEGFPALNRYEVQTNGGPFVSTPTNSYALPALATGTYTVVVRACNVDGCGTTSSPLTFIVDPARSLPGQPVNPRITVPPGAVGVAVNGVIDRVPFKEKGLDVVSVAPEGGGQLLIGAAGLRDTSGGFVVQKGDNVGVVVSRPIQ